MLGRVLRRVVDWVDAEQHRRDIKCWHKGHRRRWPEDRCRRCGR